ncbi:SHD1 domain-containing protein [Novipirellula rosea]
MNFTVVRTIATLYVAFSLAPPLVQAADTFRVGESVAFSHEKQWHVGTVVQVERGRAMVSAEVDGEPTQGVFAMNVLRRPPWTLGSRFWSDQSGKFRIKAAVVDVTTEALQLLKAEGGTVAVPIDKLSDGDQEIAAKLVAAKQAYQASLATADPTDNEAANSSEPRVMSADATKSQVDRSEHTSVSAAQSGVRLATLIPLGEQATTSIRLEQESLRHQKFFKPRSSLLQASPDMQPMALNIGEPLLSSFPEATVRYPGYRDESVDRVYPIGGQNASVLVQVTRPAKGIKNKALRWVSLVSGEVSAPFLLAEGEQVACVEPSSGRLLTHAASQDQSGEKFYQWRIYAGNPAESAVELQSEIRQLFGYPYNGSALPSFLPNNRLLLQGGRDLKVVDLDSGEVAFSLDYVFQTHSHCLAHLSPDRRYLAVYFTHDAPAKRLILDLQSFDLVHCSSIPDRTFEAFSADGKHLVSLQGTKLVWLSTQSWQPARTDEIPGKWAGTGSPFHVLDERYIINSRGSLLDLQANEIVTELRSDGIAGNPSLAPSDAWVGNCLLRTDTSSAIKVVACTQLPASE